MSEKGMILIAIPTFCATSSILTKFYNVSIKGFCQLYELTPSRKVFLSILISPGDPSDQFGSPPSPLKFEALNRFSWAGTPTIRTDLWLVLHISHLLTSLDNHFSNLPETNRILRNFTFAVEEHETSTRSWLEDEITPFRAHQTVHYRFYMQ